MTAYHHPTAIRTLFVKTFVKSFTKSVATRVATHRTKSRAMGLSHALWACDAPRSSLEKREVDSEAEVDGS